VLQERNDGYEKKVNGSRLSATGQKISPSDKRGPGKKTTEKKGGGLRSATGIREEPKREPWTRLERKKKPRREVDNWVKAIEI